MPLSRYRHALVCRGRPAKAEGRKRFLAGLLCATLGLVVSGTPAQAGSTDKQRAKAVEAARLCAGNRGVRHLAEVNVLCLEGDIDIDGKLTKQILAIKPRRKVMVVMESPGGGMAQAIRITEHLEKSRFDMTVSGICASACAQFIFMGARHKFIVGKGGVFIHGGPIPVEKIDAMDLQPKQKENLKLERLAFIDFYRKRGIDMKILINAPPNVLKRINQGEIIFWAPKRAEFPAFGVKNVEFIDATLMEH